MIKINLNKSEFLDYYVVLVTFVSNVHQNDIVCIIKGNFETVICWVLPYLIVQLMETFSSFRY